MDVVEMGFLKEEVGVLGDKSCCWLYKWTEPACQEEKSVRRSGDLLERMEAV